jgi:benzoylformate decarboxylase
MTIPGVSKRLEGHDLVVVIGAPVFRYYPFLPGQWLPDGTEVLHVTCDPDTAAYAASGDSMLGDAKWSAPEVRVGVIRRRPTPCSG